MVGQPADFSPKVDAPSAIDYLLGALASDLAVGFKAQASRRNIEIDQLEVSLKAGLENVLFHLELEDEGSPQEYKKLKVPSMFPRHSQKNP